MNTTLKQIGRLALEKLLNSARFRPQNPEADFHVTFSNTDFDLNQLMQDLYRRDHDSSYHAGQNYLVWGIELGLQELAIPDTADQSFFKEIIKQTVPTLGSALPSHFIVANWSNSDHHSDKSYVVFRLSDAQDKALRMLHEKMGA